jgi:hypothetical protein
MAVCTPPRFGISPRSAARPAASQFLASTGSLALQVSGPGRPTRLVRIRSAKCTVGSAAGCTLRLRAGGVDSLHCWILRGEAGTVIRRLNGVATLNGTHFDEALLSVGDRVALGSIEFVVAECNAALPIEQIPVSASTRFDNDVLELQTRLDSALEQIKRLEFESRQGFESSIMAAERADQLRDALAEANQQLEDVCGELAAAQDALAAKTSELEAQTAKLGSLEGDDQSNRVTIHGLESQASALAAQCHALTNQLQELQAAQATERESWTQERLQLTQRCERLAGEVQAVGGELSARSEAATIVFEQHALAGAVADAKLNELTEQLAAKQSEIEALQQRLDAQAVITNRLEQLTCDYDHKCREVAELQARCEELSSRSTLAEDLEQKAQSLQQLQAELANREGSLAEATRALDEERAALTAKTQQLEATRDDLATEQQRLADLRRDLEQSQAGFSDLDQRRAELEAKAAELASRDAEIAARIAEVNHLLEQLVDQRATLASREQELAERLSVCESRLEEINHQATQLAALRDELRARAEQLAEQEALALRSAAERQASEPAPQPAAPVEPSNPASDEAEMDSVLSRLVQAGVWRQAEGPSSESPAAVPAEVSAAEAAPAEAGSGEVPHNVEEPVCSTMVFESPEPAAPMFARPQYPSAPHSDEEESIESYMDRLMKRVRGDDGVGQSNWKASSAIAASAPTSAPVPEPAAAVEPTPSISDSQPTEYSPRRTAPELSTDLSAMRDLANSAARTAIDQHIRQHTSRRATQRLLGAFVIVVLSLAMGYWAWRIHSFQAALGAGLGGAIGSYWTLTALRRLSGLKRLDRETVRPATTPAAEVGLPGENGAKR